MTPSRFLALGDSYTVGEGVARDAIWPAQLVRALSASGTPLAPPDVVATTGWTTDELAVALRGRVLAPRYALVSLGIGVNDQYRGRDIASYRESFTRLLWRAVAFAGDDAAHVFVMSIPDWGVTPFAQDRDPVTIAAAIDAFNALAQAQTAGIGARFVDVTAISRACGSDPAMLAVDGLHPSAAQYTRWLTAILPAARACLAA